MAKALAAFGAKLIVKGHTPEKMDVALDQYIQEGFDLAGYLFDVRNAAEVEANKKYPKVPS